MGIKKDTIDRLFKLGIDNPKILTLGRQKVDKSIYYFDQYRPANILSVDIDDYEKPNFVADICSDNFVSTVGKDYDIVFDGGTLEHCYDVPKAMANITRVIKKAGFFLSAQEVNFSGHGFWNISPEFFFKWCGINGYTNAKCFIKRLGPFARWRELKFDPEKRIELTSIVPLHYNFLAKKVIAYDTLQNNLTQAPPSSTKSVLYFWLWETRLFKHKLAAKNLH